MQEKKIAIIAGARPNFMKIVPLVFSFQKENLPYYVINTGQHFDESMAKVFFDEFGVQPDYSLTPSTNSVVVQFTDIMIGIEKIFIENVPALVVVVGDVNSTLAGALVANKMHIPVVHVEAGLRSHNAQMPEETNRILTDHISDILFVTMEEGVQNLEKENVRGTIYQVGNIMIDTLVQHIDSVESTSEKFYFCTLHRAENVDNKNIFSDILNALQIISEDAKIYLPLHPRTKKKAIEFGLLSQMEQIFEMLPPLSYKESLYYQKNAALVLTDSGGVQEETSYLGTPCLTLRTETERPITVSEGTNTLAGVTKESILSAYREKNQEKKHPTIDLWDGKTGERITKILKDFLAE
jgi:UDP-N-acetylglucosamine 2-epimerase (non-hydrolysing)